MIINSDCDNIQFYKNVCVLYVHLNAICMYVHLSLSLDIIYYPPEVSSMKYCCLGVFRKEYFRLVITYCKQRKKH